MWRRRGFWKLLALGLSGGALALLVACGGGDSGQSSVTPAATTAAAGTSAASPTEQASAGKLPILAAVPNAPPRATPTPLPSGVTPAPPPSPPVPPAPQVSQISFYVDTVTAGKGESKLNVDADRSCARNSTFRRGMHIVWRMKLTDNTGTELQDANVASAVLKLPGIDDVKFRFGRHGSTADAPWFWTAAWDAPMDYPLGAVDYSINVATKDGKTGTFKEIPVSNPASGVESRLQIIE